MDEYMDSKKICCCSPGRKGTQSKLDMFWLCVNIIYFPTTATHICLIILIDFINTSWKMIQRSEDFHDLTLSADI